MATTASSCAHCGAAAATRCTGCIEGLEIQGNLSPTFYCSVECQKADWNTHKPLCRNANQRKQLYRGALLAQDIYYALREIGFDSKILGSQKQNGCVRLTIDRSRPTNNRVIYALPNQLTASQADKKAVLSWMANDMAIGYSYKLIEKVLKGIISTTEAPVERKILVCKARATVTEVNGRFTDPKIPFFDHSVTDVTLKSDDRFVIDLAGAQYGQYQAAMDFSQYCSLGLGGITLDEKALGQAYSKKVASFQELRAKAPSYGYPADLAHHAMMRAVDGVIDRYEKESGKTVAEILNLKQAEFDVQRAQVLSLVTAKMREVVQKFNANPAQVVNGF